MNVKELKEALSAFPDYMEVLLPGPDYDTPDDGGSYYPTVRVVKMKLKKVNKLTIPEFVELEEEDMQSRTSDKNPPNIMTIKVCVIEYWFGH